ncbi:MAG TPA: hypothetical protein VN455_09545 [Methanotrichaceae archaeon]|nr:hypothetical protein [Methanotrichaceae archaeon]
MANESGETSRECCGPCTRVVKFMVAYDVPPNAGASVPPYTEVDGYRYINIFVRFSQQAAEEQPVDLGVIFAFDADGTMGARRYINLEANIPAPQVTHFVEVSGTGTWHGSQAGMSSYMVRLPVMGPFVQVIAYNRAPIKRTVSIWAYLVS